MSKIIPFQPNRNKKRSSKKAGKEAAPSLVERVNRLRGELESLALLAKEHTELKQLPSFMEFEAVLKDKLDTVGRGVLELFMTHAEQRVAAACKDGVKVGKHVLRPVPELQARNLTSRFGVIRYFRTYVRRRFAERRQGFHPLDAMLGLSADRISWTVLSLATRLATRVSYAEAYSTLGLFVPTTPSTEVIEQTVLGLGKFTGDWFEQLPAPEGDGEVLVVMIDSKGAPTATEEELSRRRGKRQKRPKAPSPRHRGRNARTRYPKKPRRKKGDKSKNAKMATLIVMYTLKRSGQHLLGPINRFIYSSFAPKEHAFQIARRESNKRGFAENFGRIIQLVTDGDPDLDFYAKRYFPEAIHTIDVMHVIEKLWKASESVYPEGSPEQKRWVEFQKKRLYDGAVDKIITELQKRLKTTPKTGPGNKGRRTRLEEVIRYLTKRSANLNYKELLEQDLEIGSGAVEGAVKNVIAKRCDHGGMRWIKERVEALVQLRCIEINGHWDSFLSYVNERIKSATETTGIRQRLQTQTPAPLPSVLDPSAFANSTIIHRKAS